MAKPSARRPDILDFLVAPFSRRRTSRRRISLLALPFGVLETGLTVLAVIALISVTAVLLLPADTQKIVLDAIRFELIVASAQDPPPEFYTLLENDILPRLKLPPVLIEAIRKKDIAFRVAEFDRLEVHPVNALRKIERVRSAEGVTLIHVIYLTASFVERALGGSQPYARALTDDIAHELGHVFFAAYVNDEARAEFEKLTPSALPDPKPWSLAAISPALGDPAKSLMDWSMSRREIQAELFRLHVCAICRKYGTFARIPLNAEMRLWLEKHIGPAAP